MARDSPASATSGFSPVSKASAVASVASEIFAWIALSFARGNITTAHFVKAKSGNKVRRSVDGENSRDAHAVVNKTHKRARSEHAALYAHKHCSIRSRELAWRNHFLHQGVDRRPIHRRARPRDERHGVQLPQFQMAAPRDVRGAEHGNTSGEVQQHAEVAPVQPIDEH